MEFKIKRLGKLRIVGVKERIHTGETVEDAVPELWKEVMENGLLSKLLMLNDGELTGPIGLCYNYDEDGSMDYCVGVDTTKTIKNCVEIEVEETQYAVFECTMANIQETWRDIFINWLPNVEHEFTGAPSFEYYPYENKCEIYIPIS